MLGTLPAFALLSLGITPVFRARLSEKFTRGAKNHAFLVEAITGIQTVKAMAVEPRMQRRWEEQLASYVCASFRTLHIGNVAGQLGACLSKATTIVVLWVGAQAVMGGQLTVGELIAFNMLASRVISPVLRLVQVWQDLQQAGVSVARLGDVLNAPREPSGPSRTALPAIARALVTDPRILILDEATSALDYESEHLIQQNLAQICAGRTVFIIAHRLRTVRVAHQILVIDQGRLIKRGTHDELMRLGGYYARLHRLQDGSQATAPAAPAAPAAHAAPALEGGRRAAGASATA